MDELKSCPFCNGKAYIHKYAMVPFERRYIEEENDGYFYVIECSKCDVSSGNMLSENEAIAAWNRRAGEDG